MRRPIIMSALLFLCSPSVCGSTATAQEVTLTSQTTAPANKTSCEFQLDRACTGVTKIEVNDGLLGTWADRTDDYCVSGGTSNRPTVKKKNGDIPTGKKIRITVSYDSESPNIDADEDWGTETCTVPVE